MPISVYAFHSLGAVMHVVHHAIDHGSEMFRNADNQSPGWQLVSAYMHRAAGADLHRRGPHPTQRLHDSLDGCLVDARPRVALAALNRARALVGRCAVHEVIDLLIRETCCDCSPALCPWDSTKLRESNPQSQLSCAHAVQSQGGRTSRRGCHHSPPVATIWR
jgi:hypothetical protein